MILRHELVAIQSPTRTAAETAARQLAETLESMSLDGGPAIGAG